MGGLIFLIVCKNYNSLTCLNVFFAIFNFDNKIMFLFGRCFSMKTTPRKPSILVGFLRQKKELCKHPLVSAEAGPLLRQPEKVQIDLGKKS